MFALHRTDNVEAEPQIKYEHRPPLIVGLRSDGMVILLAAPVMLLVHQFRCNSVAAKIGMNTTEPTIKMAGLSFVAEFATYNMVVNSS